MLVDRPASGQSYVSCGHDDLVHWWRTDVTTAWEVGDVAAVWLGACEECFDAVRHGMWEEILVVDASRFPR